MQPDQRKGPARRPTRTGLNRNYQLPQFTQIASRPQRRRSLGAIAAQLRDDGALPIRVRVFALQAAHRLSVGGTLAPQSERELRLLQFQRRRQLKAAARLHGIWL